MKRYLLIGIAGIALMTLVIIGTCKLINKGDSKEMCSCGCSMLKDECSCAHCQNH